MFQISERVQRFEIFPGWREESVKMVFFSPDTAHVFAGGRHFVHAHVLKRSKSMFRRQTIVVL